MPRLIAALPEGPVDIIGDIHGEIDALDRLLEKLGVDVAARRATRPLVFVGDLVDRGPDSVAVVQRVADLVDAGLATVVLGNHELNLLQGDRKQGNGWFWGEGGGGAPDHFTLTRQGVGVRHLFQSRGATESERRFILDFFRTLPLVAQNTHLRVVHAAPQPDAIASLPVEGDVVALAAEADARTRAALDALDIREKARQERARWADLRDYNLRPTEMLEHVALEAKAEQSQNPISILTSGLEMRIDYKDIFYAGGKWRFVARDPWWTQYGAEESEPDPHFVVVGHYWRRRPGQHNPDKADVWRSDRDYGWSGPRERAFCVDFSVGRRFAERVNGVHPSAFAGGLAALRWPEGAVVFDDRPDAVTTGLSAPAALRKG